MKILMLLESNFPPDTRVENEINALTESGHEVHLACVKTVKNLSEKSYGKVTIHRELLSEFQRKSSTGALIFPFYFHFWRKFVNNLFAFYQFDAIHVHDLPLAVIGCEMKRKFGVKFILDLHENWPGLLAISEHLQTFPGNLLFSLKQWQKYERKYVNLADEVIVVVDEAKDRIESLGVDRERIHVVSNTLNLDGFSFDIQKKVSDKIIFTYAGGVTYHRGLQYVLDAAALVADDRFEIWIVGDGRYLNTLKKQAGLLGLDDQVRFWGRKNQTELLRLVCESDIALIPHVKSAHTDSTIPHKLFQYMYAEKPVLASDCIPVMRIIHETRSGWVYPWSDAKQLASFMKKIINNEFNLNDYAQGKSFVISKYNWSVDKLNLLTVYL
ncbi:MAG: glycosyltransferase family 4 protein [Prolixibacteraceae bacterium]